MLSWAVLSWAELSCAELSCAGLGLAVLGLAVLGLAGLGLAGLGLAGLNLAGLIWVGQLEGPFTVSGLSLVLFRVLPLGGLTTMLGRVVMLSIFGNVYWPKTVGSTLRYSLSPRVLIHSSMLS